MVSEKVLLAIAVLYIPIGLWIAWPQEPTYHQLLRNQNLPLTFQELNAMYAQVDDEKNVALKYEALGKENFVDLIAYQDKMKASQGLSFLDSVWGAAKHGTYMPDYNEAITAQVEADTRAYYANVSGNVVPALLDLAVHGGQPARYSIDIAEATWAEPHWNACLALARELSVGTHVAILDRDPDRAIHHVEAILALSRSLELEPLERSLQIFLQIQGVADTTVQDILNRCVMTDSQLERLQGILEGHINRDSHAQALMRSKASENVFRSYYAISETYHQSYSDNKDYYARLRDRAFAQHPLKQLYAPYHLELIFLGLFQDDALHAKYMASNYSRSSHNADLFLDSIHLSPDLGNIYYSSGMKGWFGVVQS